MMFLNELKGLISIEMQKWLTKHNVTNQPLLNLFRTEGDDGIFQFCTKKDENNQVRIIKNKRVISKLTEHLKTTDL